MSVWIPPSQVLLGRLYDLLASAAQVISNAGDTVLGWGQHITDDSGDNLSQTGLHGTSQATLAFAAGIQRVASSPLNSRYRQFLQGGVRHLTGLSRDRGADLQKTVKLAELVGALAAAGETDCVGPLTDKLIAGRSQKTGAWSWKVDDKNDTADVGLLIPTVYALDGLSHFFQKTGRFDHELSRGIQFCTEVSLPLNLQDKELVGLCRLCEILPRCNMLKGANPITIERQLCDIRAKYTRKRIDIRDIQRFEYRIQDEHAFCVIPAGVIELRARLWLNRHSPGFQTELDVIGALHELMNIYCGYMSISANDFKMISVRNISYVARLFADLADMIDKCLLSGAARQSSSLIFPPVLTDSPVPQKSDATDSGSEERSRNYSQAVTAKEGKAFSIRVKSRLTDGYSDASLDLCETKPPEGPSRLEVFKLAAASTVESEEGGARLARDIIMDKESRIELRNVYDYGDGRRFLRYEYAGRTLRNRDLKPLLEYMKIGGNMEKAVENLFRIALPHAVKAEPNEPMRTLPEVLAEFEKVRNGKFWEEVTNGVENLRLATGIRTDDHGWGYLLLPVPFGVVPSPLLHWERCREQTFPSAYACYGHGDLNPRNVLMARRQSGSDEWRPAVIDFHRFAKSVAQPLDFCRLEVGICIKGLRDYFREAGKVRDSYEELVSFERTINGYGGTPQLTISTGQTELKKEFLAVTKVIASIRLEYVSIAPQQIKEDPRQFWGILMLCYMNYMRPLYDSVLTAEQRLFALYSASQIYWRHFLQPAGGCRE